jgi:hypothetical protein
VHLATRPTRTRPAKAVEPIRRGAARLRPIAVEAREWLARQRARLAEHVGSRFRLTASEEPAPQPGRIAAVCGWAAGLGVTGLLVGAMALLRIWFGDNAGWYQPTVIIVGLAGIVCTIGALASVHRYRLPWFLLAAASTALLTALALTISG